MQGHVAVVGGGFGDESKGATVDWLCRRDGGPRPVAVARLGGHQAGHNVVEPGGRHHTFSQFGSGTLAGVPTHLTRYMTVEPTSLVAEADHLISIGISDPYRHLTIDGDCMVVTPFHRWGNLSNADNLLHGTCGKGHGEAKRLSIEHPEEVLRVRDLKHRSLVAWILGAQKRRFEREYPNAGQESWSTPDHLMRLCDVYQMFAQAVRIVASDYLGHLMRRGSVIFEHSQGVLLDEWRGFHPFTTWSTTTFEWVDKLLADNAPDAEVFRLMCMRAYTTRHGAGPFPTERQTMVFPEPHNDGGMQGQFRQGHFDAVLHRYAIRACGRVDGIALSHLDLVDDLAMCQHYMLAGMEPKLGPPRDLEWSANQARLLSTAIPTIMGIRPVPEAVEEALDVPVVLAAYGPTHEDRRARSLVG